MFKLQKSIGLIGRIKKTKLNLTNNVNEKLQRFEKKVEGTMVENWLKYWKNVCKDYKDVALDVVKESKEKPTKAILISSGIGLTTYCFKHNPNATHFRDAYLNCANEIALVHHELVRDETKDHIKQIEYCYNNDLIRYTSLGVVSLMWIDNYSKKCSKFETQCSYLKLSYFDVLHRVVDIGFLDTWWILAKKMTDYDINY